MTREAPLWSILLLALAVAALPAMAGATTIDALGAVPDPDFPEFAERVAFLTTADDGSQQLTARLVSKVEFSGLETGDRIFGDVVIDGIWGTGGVAIWGTGGVAFDGLDAEARDVLVSGLVKPGSVLVLLDDLRVVEIRGIWGTGGVAAPTQDQIVVHGPMWPEAACGAATTFAETLREVADPDAATDDPLLVIGTEGGCVGLAGYPPPHAWDPVAFPDPNEWYPDPNEWQPVPLSATGDPLVAIWGTGGVAEPVDDLAATRVSGGWGVIPAGFLPDTADWVEGEDVFPDPNSWYPDPNSWYPNPNDWFPNPNNWFPNPNEWFEVTALSGGQAFGVFPGARPIGEHLAAPPYATFTLDGSVTGAPLSSLATPGFPIGHPGEIVVDDGAVLLKTPLAGANGTVEVFDAALSAASVEWGSTTTLEVEGTLTAPFELSTLTLASLWGIAADGQRILFDPEGDLVDPVELGGVLSVDLGPKAHQRSANGTFVTAAIEASGEDATTIDVLSPRLGVFGDPEAPLAPERTDLTDQDGDGNLELVIKFDRQELNDRLAPFEDDIWVLLELSWKYLDECDLGVPCTGATQKAVKIVP